MKLSVSNYYHISPLEFRVESRHNNGLLMVSKYQDENRAVSINTEGDFRDVKQAFEDVIKSAMSYQSYRYYRIMRNSNDIITKIDIRGEILNIFIIENKVDIFPVVVILNKDYSHMVEPGDNDIISNHMDTFIKSFNMVYEAYCKGIGYE
jgi:hypothetical protein